MKLNEASEPGFYVAEDDEERLYLYEVLKNTDEEWLEEEPDAILLVDEWIYVYTDYDDRKVYESNGTLQCIDLVDSFNVIRLKDKFKMFGESGQYLVQNKPTYKELYMQLLEINKMLEQENQELKDKLSKIKKNKERNNENEGTLKEVNKMSKFIIQDKEAGNYIDSFTTLKEAQQALREYETQDKAEGIYTPNFYGIIEADTDR